MARPPRLAARLAGSTPRGNAAQFGNVYGRPQRIKAGLATNTLNPGQGLAQAQAKRQNLAQSLLAKPGARQGLQNAYGPGFHPGDLKAALRTVHSAHAQVDSGQQPPDLLSTNLYRQAVTTAHHLLGIRKNYLSRAYTRAPAAPQALPGP